MVLHVPARSVQVLVVARRHGGDQGRLRRLLRRQPRQVLHRRERHREALRARQALLHLQHSRPLRRGHEARGHRRRRRGHRAGARQDDQAPPQEERRPDPGTRGAGSRRRRDVHRRRGQRVLAHRRPVAQVVLRRRHASRQGCRGARRRRRRGRLGHVRRASRDTHDFCR